ncbi:Diphthamide biosynthesis protein 2 [Lobulomyces angularis]|nr:Diphthamide biosynthesis protein 2 [Lobulomyces angularis]
MSVITNDGSAIIEKQTNINANANLFKHIEHTKHNYFEINDIADLIIKNNFEHISLQFPDLLIPFSNWVSTTLKQKTKKNFYILGDTSYGSCCVDEVSAQHANSDFLVHFGKACLTTKTSQIPVKYCFGKEPFNFEKFIDLFKEFILLENSIKFKNILLECEVNYYHVMEELKASLGSLGFNVKFKEKLTEIGFEKVENATLGCYETEKFDDFGNELESVILFIGAEGFQLTNTLMTNPSKTVSSFNPMIEEFRIENLKVNKMLMKRYLSIHKARDANVVGIVVGTLGIYILSVGKPNPAKLANFLEIDVFVFLGCPQSVLELIVGEESKDYVKPIVSVFEMEIALGGGPLNEKESETDQTRLGWIPGGAGKIGEYITDFVKISSRLKDEVEEMSFLKKGHDISVSSDESDDEPHFSLASGAYENSKRFVEISSSKEEEESKFGINDNNALIKREVVFGNGKVSKISSAGADYLNNRTFKGLEIALQNLEPSILEEGRDGIAKGYQGS